MPTDPSLRTSIGSVSPDSSLRILLVEAESDLREMRCRFFSEEGNEVTAIADGRAAIDRAGTGFFDVVLLGTSLGSGPDGYEVCRILRARRNDVPIVMLTAEDSQCDVVRGLDGGADDYVAKPLAVAELHSRIRAVLRRGRTQSVISELLIAGPIVLERSSREVRVNGQAVGLTFHQFELLDALMTEPGRTFDRQELLRAIWGDSGYRDPHGINVHIRRLRQKLEADPGKPRYILTVRGVGYQVHLPRDQGN